MRLGLLSIVVAVLAFAPFVAIAAGAAQRNAKRGEHGLSEFVAVIALSLTLDASILGVWGATHAATYVEFTWHFFALFALLQPGIPLFCFLKVVRPGRSPSRSDEPSSRPTVF